MEQNLTRQRKLDAETADDAAAASRRLLRDRALIINPDAWPKYPVLPLKRRDEDATRDDFTSFVFSDVNRRPIAYFGNIWAINGAQAAAAATLGRAPTWGELLATFQQRAYANIGALLADYTID